MNSIGNFAPPMAYIGDHRAASSIESSSALLSSSTRALPVSSPTAEEEDDDNDAAASAIRCDTGVRAAAIASLLVIRRAVRNGDMCGDGARDDTCDSERKPGESSSACAGVDEEDGAPVVGAAVGLLLPPP